MLMKFFVLRDGSTATSVSMDVDKLDVGRRWLYCTLRGSGSDFNRYHFYGCTELQDISGTDKLEEVTGTMTGTTYSIVNSRIVTGSHLEVDLEPLPKEPDNG